MLTLILFFLFFFFYRPYIILWIVSFFDKKIEGFLYRVGKVLTLSGAKAEQELEINYRDPMNSVVEMSHSLIQNGNSIQNIQERIK